MLQQLTFYVSRFTRQGGTMSTKSENFAEPQDIRAILAMKRIAVVGLSSDPWRPSYDVTRYMMQQGYEITPVNPKEKEVFGQPAYASLGDLPEPPEVVNVFRRAEFVSEVVDEAIAAGAKALWLQFDVVDYAAARRAREAGLIVVMNRCIKVEHARNSWSAKGSDFT